MSALALVACDTSAPAPPPGVARGALESSWPGASTVAEARASIAAPQCQVGAARWGADDEAGQSNTQTDAKMLEAARYIKNGSQRFVLGHGMVEGMPEFRFPTLVGYHLAIENGTHRVALGPVVAHEELVTSEIGQVGTEIDALGHMCFIHGASTDPGDGDCYGGRKERDIWTPTGLAQLGVEQIKPYFTRGILLDVMRYANGGVRLAPGQVVTLEMIMQTMAAEHLRIDDLREGDVVLVRTGHDALWNHPELGDYYGSTPGIDLEVARFFASRCLGNIGADNWPVEVQPSVDGGFVPVHEYTLTVAGFPQQENLRLGAFADYLATLDGGDRYIFAYTYAPLALVGATGSPGAPIAIK